MHFTCESCRATLHIADEKVKGKRLVVRCKRCGNKINIADPALAGSGAAKFAQPIQRPAPVEHRPVDPDEGQDGDSDTESTRAMESAVLEEALRASKAAGEEAAAKAVAAPPPAAAPRDPPVWFAMVGGKQLGPVSRAELGLKTAQGAVGPRTYVWKEGMGAWQRAKDVAELSSLFAAPPEPQRAPPPPIATPAATPRVQAQAAAPQKGAGLREFSTGDFGDLKLGQTAGGANGEGSFRELSAHELGGAAQGGEQSGDLLPGMKAPPAKAAAPGRPATQVVVNQHPEPKPEPKVKPLDISIEGFQPLNVDDGGDATNVESMPLGERIHQEEVAKELFTSGDQGGASAIDLARWAESELSRKEQQRAQVTSESGRVTPQKGSRPLGAGAGPSSAQRDAEGLVPETTGEVMKRAGVQSGRRTLVFVGAAVGVLVVALILLYLATRGPAPAPVNVEVAAPHRTALGGTGDTSTAGLIKNDKAQAPGRAASPGGAAREGSKADDPGTDGAKLTSEQEAAVKALGNERGVGTHGPKAGGEDLQVAREGSGLSREDFDRVVADNKPGYKQCIDEALRRNPKLRVGKVQIALSIAPTGKVSEASIDKKDVQESALGQCLIRTTQRLSFPAFGGEATPGVIPLYITRE